MACIRAGRDRVLGTEAYRKPRWNPRRESDKRVLALRTCVYDPRMFGEQEDKLYRGLCAICLVAWKEGEEIAVTRCGHVFHEACICEWIRKGVEADGCQDWKRATCAMCRSNLYCLASELEAPVDHNVMTLAKCCIGCCVFVIVLCIMVPSLMMQYASGNNPVN
eukprot:gnl/TRDRNA2_/TRDRNA2_125619_c0_seq1.p1 gnl/TRDRNA2_/TRDRNA2_125619_c0~~gnl/TRDRNA2_/TRDRNA2_125619_c0_seq1.p1  ORF type:complete len:164 (-),score=24.32 gnl/TRDRNA2_/TRDRNA2_125619_c0_seq1:123-614(-)